MIDPDTIRRNGYALAELEGTVACFCAGVSNLCGSLPAHDGRRGIEALGSAMEWPDRLALICERPPEAT